MNFSRPIKLIEYLIAIIQNANIELDEGVLEKASQDILDMKKGEIAELVKQLTVADHPSIENISDLTFKEICWNAYSLSEQEATK